jgi:hypothetical protein
MKTSLDEYDVVHCFKLFLSSSAQCAVKTAITRAAGSLSCKCHIVQTGAQTGQILATLFRGSCFPCMRWPLQFKFF